MAQIKAAWPQVLVLEPERLSRQYLVQALEALDLAVCVPEGTGHDLARQQRERVRLLIVGMGHNSTENLQLLRQTRQAFAHAVLMGVCPRIPSAERCLLLDAGLDFVLEKPFFVDECVSTIRALLRRHPLRAPSVP